ncbi:DUF3310 domain-containing protein [Paracoccus sp. NGMCC 1.201697]|uniref:DUF3310 domain-containing protein n=1 Tax=Paracoccus broussonetiae subsp. drimophilus TaxID=3373869 RepID=A0ABW7LRR0_9RHOB
MAAGNAIEYVSRYRKKGRVQNLRKAHHMLYVSAAQADD